MNGVNGFNQFFTRSIFGQITTCTRIYCIENKFLRSMHRKYQDTDTRIIVVQFLGYFDARHTRQGNIKHCDIGLRFFEKSEQIFSVCSFTDYFKTRFPCQQISNSCSYKLVVIHQNQSDFFHFQYHKVLKPLLLCHCPVGCQL